MYQKKDHMDMVPTFYIKKMYCTYFMYTYGVCLSEINILYYYYVLLATYIELLLKLNFQQKKNK